MNTGKDTQAALILGFYQSLKPVFALGEGIEIMNPFIDELAWKYTVEFYKKFYSDHNQRKIIVGINPGRFGGGITGIPFTDPIRLKQDCGIDNPFIQKAELSSVFVYKVVHAYGGPKKFFGDFFISALSPLGYTKNGTNLNYYDDKELLIHSEPFIIDCLQQQVKLLHLHEDSFCLGEGTNYKIFHKLNARYKFFKTISPLPHPRWIMQYRRKRVDEFVDKYLSVLSGD